MVEISNFHVTNIIISVLALLLIVFLIYILIYKLVKRLVNVGLDSNKKIKELENRIRQLEEKDNITPE
ncbi:hypothetical protein H8S33_05520 [Ornithinibacillus sp. BX22]|uniref:DUF4083 domain-containing protein n=2 Tax=Ornithinibacillus TaxID=484508 RepID=A0A923L4E9_9BACI|nr:MULTISPECIES: hypothetical protein [Ornithinibacillus]MBC5636285.1 hypothetical protein [Ornithinibacillus hominis]MBS3681127.1 hypothetical protein [Ornithinibacillus massiliensis]